MQNDIRINNINVLYSGRGNEHLRVMSAKGNIQFSLSEPRYPSQFHFITHKYISDPHYLRSVTGRHFISDNYL